eukprot:7595-Heterococcus_DN1.PRE.5
MQSTADAALGKSIYSNSSSRFFKKYTHDMMQQHQLTRVPDTTPFTKQHQLQWNARDIKNRCLHEAPQRILPAVSFLACVH